MKIKRIVKIGSFGVGGCSFTVTFKGVAYREPHVIDSPTPRITTDWSSMSGNEKELQITSRYLNSPEEAAKWIEELTKEVKAVVNLDKGILQQFSALQGESDI